MSKYLNLEEGGMEYQFAVRNVNDIKYKPDLFKGEHSVNGAFQSQYSRDSKKKYTLSNSQDNNTTDSPNKLVTSNSFNMNSSNETLPKSKSFHSLDDSLNTSLEKASLSLEQILHPILDHFEKEQQNNKCECGEKSGRIGVPYPCNYCSVTKNIPRVRRSSLPNYTASIQGSDWANSVHSLYGRRDRPKRPKRVCVSTVDNERDSVVIDTEEVALNNSRSDLSPVKDRPKFTSTAEFLCSYRIQKFLLSISAAAIIAHFIMGIPLISMSFFNYTIVLAIFAIYPISCLIGFAYDKVKPQKIQTTEFIHKYLKKLRINNHNVVSVDDVEKSNDETIIEDVVYVPERRHSHCRKVSVVSQLASISEEDGLGSERIRYDDEDDKGYSSHSDTSLNKIEDRREIRFYKPCKDCLRGNTLGICLHPPT